MRKMLGSMINTWREIETIIATGVHVLLYGPPGTGKTFAATMGRDTFSITLTIETPAAELRGHYLPRGTSFDWHDGPAIRAWRDGARLALNEIDQASGDVLTLMHAILDDQEIARLTLPSGETVRPIDGFQAIATTNATDLPMVLSPALLDRFSVRIFVDEPHPNAVARIKSDALRDMVLTTIRKPAEQRFSLREAIALERLLNAGIGAEAAARSIVGSKDLADAITLAVAAETKQRKVRA